MGTMLELRVWEADTARAREALAAARAAVFRVDTLMSLYKPESELSAVNRRAGTDSITTLSLETAEVLEAALEFADRTDGALDVTVGPVVDVWGFYRHEGRVPPRAVLDSARSLVGYRQIVYDPSTRGVRLPRRGMRLDFGAIAKGYAVDRAVQVLRAAGLGRGMVDLGGNSRTFGLAPDGHAWRVGIRHPRDPEEVYAVVTLDSGAVATSGDYEQFFVHEGVRYSHIFDPRTGWPARGTMSASAFAPTGMAADALSTALFVLGSEEGCRLARRLPGVEAVWARDPGETAEGVAPGESIYTPGLEGRLQLLLHELAPRVRPCPAAPLPAP